MCKAQHIWYIDLKFNYSSSFLTHLQIDPSALSTWCLMLQKISARSIKVSHPTHVNFVLREEVKPVCIQDSEMQDIEMRKNWAHISWRCPVLQKLHHKHSTVFRSLLFWYVWIQGFEIGKVVILAYNEFPQMHKIRPRQQKSDIWHTTEEELPISELKHSYNLRSGEDTSQTPPT